MRTMFSRLGKTRIAISVFFIIMLSVICYWQFFKSNSKHNLAGTWKLTFVNQSGTYKKHVGDSHSQKVLFDQHGSEITGKGEKWEYNGEYLPSNMHRPLEYMGEMEADCLKASFTLFGLLIESSGTIDVMLTDSGRKMTGTFMGTAGDTKGIVTGEKID